jgi:hypothetical protein
MKAPDILRLRLEHQCIARAGFRKPEEVVAWLGALQAQDYLGSLWAIGLRTRGATESAVEAAEARRAIIRTWPMRGTLHFVAAEDARWMTRLLAPRVIARHSARWQRDFGVDAKLVGRADEILTRALEGGRRLTRERLYELLEAKRIPTGRSRGLHLLLALALRGRLCLAGREGKQHTFALLEEWVPDGRVLEGDEALAELALRYFGSHGPATSKDFIWWSGITARQALAALDGAGTRLTSAEVEGVRYWWRESGKRSAPRNSASARVHLLPAFDEYTVAYQDRSLLAVGGTKTKMALLSPAVLLDGRVIGAWKRTLDKNSAVVTTRLSRPLDRAGSAALRGAVESYGVYLGLAAQLSGRR